MKAYSYTDSGFDMLGEAPSHWKNKRLVNICDFIRGNSCFGKNDLLSEGKYVALQYGKTYKVELVDKQFNFYVNDEFYKSSQTVDYGDVIFVSTSETIEDLGHSVFYDREDTGLIGGEQILLKPNKNVLDGKYLFYTSKVFGSKLNKFATGIKVFRFDIYDLKTIYINLPPLKEQKIIAEYLDKATARIDRIINIKKEQSNKLEKAYSSECFKILTVGTEKNPVLVDVNVGWFVRMPEKWRVKRLKDVVSMKSGNTISATEIDKIGSYPVYGGNGLRGYTESFTHEGQYPLMGRQGALCGNINYAEGKFFATEHAVVIRPINDTNIVWVGELMRIMNLNQYSNAAAQPGLSVDKIKQLYIPVPPKNEQEEIAKALESLEMKTTNMLKNIESQIKTLQNYRKSLIHECVTGKKQVTDRIE